MDTAILNLDLMTTFNFLLVMPTKNFPLNNHFLLLDVFPGSAQIASSGSSSGGAIILVRFGFPPFSRRAQARQPTLS